MTAKIKISSKWWLAALSWAFIVGCDETALRDNPFDPDGVAYNGESSSSEVALSSSSEMSSSSNVGSSSSEQSSSSSLSSSLSSSSSQAESSSSNGQSSSSVAPSSSSIAQSSSAQAGGVAGSLWNFKTNVNTDNLGFVYAPGVQDSLVSGSYTSLKYGIWYGYTDSELSGDHSQISPVDAKGSLAVCDVSAKSCAEAFAFESDVQALKVKLDLKGNAVNPFAGVSVRFVEAPSSINLTAMNKEGFCLTYALQVDDNSAQVKMHLGSTSIGEAQSFGYFEYKLDASSTWKTVELPWTEFEKPSFATHSVTREKSLETFTDLAFHFVAASSYVTGKSATLLIADLGWKGDACGAPAVAPNFQMP